MVQALDERLQKVVSDLEEKVKKHQKQVIFCLREFEIAGEVTGDFVPPQTDYFYHYEAGIINGKLQLADQKKLLMDILTVPLFGMEYNTYHLLGSHFIPVDRKIARTERYFQDVLHFDIKELEEIKQGQIIIDLHDFVLSDSLHSASGHRKSKLKKTNLLIGDKEVEKFFKEKRIKNYNEFFDVLKNPQFVKERIDKHYWNVRKKIGEDLAVTANEIINTFRKIQSLESSLMSATYGLKGNYDEHYFGWDDSHKGQVDEYYGLKNFISKNIEILKTCLKEGEKLYSATLVPSIKGEIIGFPKEITFDSYSTWINNSLIFDINKVFGKIDTYLHKQIEKAKE